MQNNSEDIVISEYLLHLPNKNEFRWSFKWFGILYRVLQKGHYIKNDYKKLRLLIFEYS